MMDFGMPVLIQHSTLEENAALCRELGLAFLELNMNLPDYQPGAIDVEKFQSVAREYGIYYTIHLDENLNVCDFNPKVAKAYTDTVFEMIEIAKGIGAPILNMHMATGVYFTMPEGRVYLHERYRDLTLQQLTRFRDACTLQIGKSDITICIENTGRYSDFQKEGISLLLTSDRFGLTYDIGHAADSRQETENFIWANPAKLMHMHMHDALRDEDGTVHDHLPFGAGNTDVKKYFDLAKEKSLRAVLELKTPDALKASVERVKNYVL